MQLARAGAHVTAVYARNDKAAEAFRAKAAAEGLSVDILRADLTSSKGIEAVVACIEARKTLTLSLVHCAATGVHRAVADLTSRHWDWTHALNVRAFFELIKALMPYLMTAQASWPCHRPAPCAWCQLMLRWAPPRVRSSHWRVTLLPSSRRAACASTSFHRAAFLPRLGSRFLTTRRAWLKLRSARHWAESSRLKKWPT